MNQMRGIEVDKTAPDKQLAKKMTKKSNKAKREKSILDRLKTDEKVMKFKGSGNDLYSTEDKARLA